MSLNQPRENRTNRSANLVAAQDPGELFDVVTADGAPTGIVKRRGDVHRDGDWHRAIHIWVVGHDPEIGPFLLFQRRSLLKDTMPGKLDVTVGGHVRSGETLEATLREADEEIGRPVTRDHLVHIGHRRAVNDREPDTIDRELQDVFLVRDDGPLTGYRPHPVELAALVQAPLDGLRRLLAGEAPSIETRELSALDGAMSPGVLGLEEFPTRVAPYLRAVANAGRAHLNGEPIAFLDIP